MRRRGLSVLLLFICVLESPASARPQAAAEAEPQKRVLVLHQLRRDAPLSAGMEDVYRRVLGEALGARLDYYSEYIDQYRFADPQYGSALRTYLRTRYAPHRFDVVIATTTAALRLIRPGDDYLFPGTPIVFHAGKGVLGGHHSTGVVSALDMARTVELALALHPDTRLVAVLSGASEFDRGYQELARAQLRRFEGSVSVRYLYGLPMAELEQAVTRLPRDSMICYLSISQDGAGEHFLPVEALDRLAALATVPVYGVHEIALGHGVVGGLLFSSDIVALHTATLALRVLRGEAPDSIPVRDIDPYVTRFDWRQLRRWGISEARLPPGSGTLFRELTPWERYRRYIVTAIILVVVQACLIVGLLLQRSRRRNAETTARRLAGRLLTAQEAERTNIARDLHDGVCQEMASVAVDVSYVRQKSGQADPEVQQILSSVQQRTASIAESLRLLSHDLHPTVLQHVGLLAALQAHCAEVERQHQLQITFVAEGEIEPDSRLVAVSLFRIAQEALRNAAEHGHARHATVSLARSNTELALTIADDGTGFNVSAVRRNGGLGLVSMEERARLVRGDVTIRSEPGSGTAVDVRVPVDVVDREHTWLSALDYT